MASFLRISSYNSTGTAWDKQVLIQDFCDTHQPDLLLLQETWLLNSNMSVLNNIHRDYVGNGVSGTPDDELLIGRPKGGVAILWKKTLSKLVEFHKVPDTDRACAVTITLGAVKTTCINLYLPVDSQSKTRITQEFLNTVDATQVFMEQCSSRHIILGGDFNVDFTRHNAHDVFLKNFTQINNMVCSVDLPAAEKGYTYHDPYNGCFSCIDHFIMSSGLKDSVMFVMRCNEHDNPSKHLPLLMQVKFDNCLLMFDTTDQGTDKFCDKPIAWHKVTDHDMEEYQRKQDIWLDAASVRDVANCGDTTCCDEKHRLQIDDWFQDLVKCCLCSSKHFPRVRQKKMNKPYWKEEVKPYKDDSLWWHNTWLQCGQPRNGPVYENRLIAKRQYMYAIRRYKRKEDQFRKDRMAEAICQNNTRDFFKEVKRLKGSKMCVNLIDGLVTPDEIAECFASKYDTLYNSVPSGTTEMSSISKYLAENCNHVEEIDRIVSITDVDKAIYKLKAGKSDGNLGLISSHLLLSSEVFKCHLAKLITSMVTHGYQPESLLLATIASIPKDNRGNLNSSTNYRGISLCNSISKVIDIIILNRYSHLLSTSDMQFAYKSGHSTSMCSFVVKETVNYYLNNGSQVFSCCVDLSKAFDLVKHDKLFQVLIDRNVPPVIVRIILDMYQRQSMRTVWNYKFSKPFTSVNGVRQGGIISPILFCIYIDVLLKELESAGHGCWIGSHFYGAVGYADDLKLLSPTIDGLENMLKICENFGRTFGVKYNSKKTVCMLYSREKVVDKPIVTLCGDVLTWVDSVKHLGHTITYNLSEEVDVKLKKSDLFCRVNTAVATLGKCKDSILQNVFNTQCAHLYGTVIWSFNDKNVQDFVRAWNRCVRRLFNLPFTTHTRYLPHIVERPGVLDQMYIRFVKMCHVMENSQNVKLRYLYKICMSSARSIIRRNFRKIELRLDLSLDNVKQYGASNLRKLYYSEQTDQDKAILGMLHEMRNGALLIDGFSEDEKHSIFDFICTF